MACSANTSDRGMKVVGIYTVSSPVLPDFMSGILPVCGTGGNDWNVNTEVITVLKPSFDVVYKEVLVIVLRDRDDVEGTGAAVESYDSQRSKNSPNEDSSESRDDSMASDPVSCIHFRHSSW